MGFVRQVFLSSYFCMINMQGCPDFSICCPHLQTSMPATSLVFALSQDISSLLPASLKNPVQVHVIFSNSTAWLFVQFPLPVLREFDLNMQLLQSKLQSKCQGKINQRD